MKTILPIFILLPLLGFLASIFIPRNSEKGHSINTFIVFGAHLLLALCFTGYWIFTGAEYLDLKGLVLYQSAENEFFINLYFDKVTAVYLVAGSFLTFLVSVYSRYYMHKEVGYARFFATILAFYLGYNITIFSGNFETLFAGWELLGICSFLLIAFYKERNLPVRNAVKVYSVYRIGDVGLLLAIWMSHHLWNENITFSKMLDASLVNQQLLTNSFTGMLVSLMILITAAAKSAQVPFTYWLPRAMEGPTPSSAIFYGSLSVHIGVFLLMRTFPLWEHQFLIRVLICVLGILTAIMASLTARVQSSVKSQVAYASAAQIGLMFVELSLGLFDLALIHFLGNAFLRTYQLLVSPSVVSYLIREQVYHFQARTTAIPSFKRLYYGLYILSLKEWNMEGFLNRILWNPLKAIGRMMQVFSPLGLIRLFLPIFLAGLLMLFFRRFEILHTVGILPVFFAFIGLLMLLRSYKERKNVMLAWVLVCLTQLWIALAISFNETFPLNEIVLYLGGITLAGIGGYLLLLRLKQLNPALDLQGNHGMVLTHRRISRWFFLACLALAGFPITTSFLGEDLVFSHIRESQGILAVITSLSYIVGGISVIRIYSKVCLGNGGILNDSL